MKRYWFSALEKGIAFNDHIGNIRGARTKAQKIANAEQISVCINCGEDMIEWVDPDVEVEIVSEPASAPTETEEPIATADEMKAEAIKRMKMMKILPQTIKQFEKENIVTTSEHGGMLYWADDEQKKMIENFEEKFGGKVFHAITSYTDFGKIFSLLFVSKYKCEWEMDKTDIDRNSHIAYAINCDDDWCTDMGTIGFRNQWGGLVRTW